MMLNSRPKNTLTVFLHLLAWLFLSFVLFYPPLSWDAVIPISFWTKQGVNLLIMAGLFYFNTIYITPTFLFRKSIVLFMAWFIFLIVACLVLARAVELRLGVFEDMAALRAHSKPKNPLAVDMYMLMAFTMVMALSTCLAVVQQWQRDANRREEVEKQQITSELMLLKAQINPHFFFNTLNNIYALTYSDIPVSRDAILMLSRMMRYVLYETLQDHALLSKEVSFMKDYVALMKLRLHECTKLRLEGFELTKNYEIAPMLLLPFIENAFKYGSSAIQETEIFISLKVSDGILFLKVVNQIYDNTEPLKLGGGGIGLANTRRRLELLYPHKHWLVIDRSSDPARYQVDLSIELSRVHPKPADAHTSIISEVKRKVEIKNFSG